ncbi:hypothetical protein CLF_103867 [Clonorchis sinensis]|uniref:Selenoprotein F/M domain-containing protein n=1 Tax=Clonorchis sinensis TaxID=79923 RepID=G7YAI4_CLOSI|nr:hypothetical protein CLF_103867 [Clonorchis sinensis]
MQLVADHTFYTVLPKRPKPLDHMVLHACEPTFNTDTTSLDIGSAGARKMRILCVAIEKLLYLQVKKSTEAPLEQDVSQCRLTGSVTELLILMNSHTLCLKIDVEFSVGVCITYLPLSGRNGPSRLTSMAIVVFIFKRGAPIQAGKMASASNGRSVIELEIWFTIRRTTEYMKRENGARSLTNDTELLNRSFGICGREMDLPVVVFVFAFSAFIEGQERQKYGNLRLTYKAGHRPTINLLTVTDELEESHVIETWDSDTILEFLDQRLEL